MTSEQNLPHRIPLRWYTTESPRVRDERNQEPSHARESPAQASSPCESPDLLLQSAAIQMTSCCHKHQSSHGTDGPYQTASGKYGPTHQHLTVYCGRPEQQTNSRTSPQVHH